MMINPFRIALANLRFPATPDESVALAEEAIANAATAGASLIGFPECYVPGYRAPNKPVPPPDARFLDAAWSALAAACARHRVVAVIGTERIVDGGVRA